MTKKIKIGILNITLQPHSNGKYIKLFKDVFSSKTPIKIRGHYYGIVSILELNEEKKYFIGRFYRYTHIDKNEPWIDVSTTKQIVDKDGNPIPQIDESIQPNSKAIDFVFSVEDHRLIFDVKDIAHNSIKQFFENLFTTKKQKNSVTITVEQSSESLDEILSIYKLDKLEFFINKPNPDDISKLDGDIKQRLSKLNASQMRESYITDEYSSLKPDDELRQLLLLAISNGGVTTKGKDEEGKTILNSSENHPLEIVKGYNLKESTYLDALKTFGIEVISDIKSRLR